MNIKSPRPHVDTHLSLVKHTDLFSQMTFIHSFIHNHIFVGCLFCGRAHEERGNMCSNTQFLPDPGVCQLVISLNHHTRMHPGGQEWLKVLERTSLQATEESGCVPVRRRTRSFLLRWMEGKRKQAEEGGGEKRREEKGGGRE